MTSLSVIIITKNEQKNIVKCLESVKFATEIIIFDSGSTDNTLALAHRYTDKIFNVDWPGYGIQKNRALAQASSEWVLSIDADEVVTPALQSEIAAILTQSSIYNGYRIRRISEYCQRIIRYGDWKNDYCLRLFRRGQGKFKEVAVHENLLVNGPTATLQQPLQHYSLPDLEEVINKMNQYSTLSAQCKLAAGYPKCSLSTALWRAFWTFFRGYCLKLGFLDGKRGLMLAISNAQGCYYRYLKLMLLQESNPS